MLRSRSLVCGAIIVLSVACGGDDDDDANDSSSDTTTTTTAVTSDEFESYIGLSIAEAGAQADGEGRPWRVVKEDGVEHPVTLDFNEQRLNFVVEDGTVVAVTSG